MSLRPVPGQLCVVYPASEDHSVRLWLPTESVYLTRGVVHTVEFEDRKMLSVCISYQRGRCKMGSLCNQAHVKRDVIESVDTEIKKRPPNSCCISCGDVGSLFPVFRKLVEDGDVEFTVLGVVVPTERMAYTAWWDKRVLDNDDYLAWKLAPDSAKPRFRISCRSAAICKLHRHGKCKLGVACKNVHICRDWPDS
jgi:hypothetical protein